ncbi:hypothetical protein [Erythrobacter sp. QSSC1-22B]|uniref:hypothetical protein n=1 Tax=Erythrobacter sp. QSSC1-22B TaxID=1860125 RepID=UPI001438DB82|nr:hypothetical protein [Erythrobacter sp. QSSC1-22B]
MNRTGTPVGLAALHNDVDPQTWRANVLVHKAKHLVQRLAELFHSNGRMGDRVLSFAAPTHAPEDPAAGVLA